MRIIAGLGNPGGEYEKTRHNAGRIVLEAIHAAHGFAKWTPKKLSEALVAKGEIGGTPVTLVEPETFMNESGRSLKKFVKNISDAAELVVIHDDIDLPLGTWKFSFDRGEGGHNGLRSISEVIKTRAYLRIRIGILPLDEEGKPKKPKGEDAVLKFVLGKFSATERKALDKMGQEVSEAIGVLLKDGLAVAMNKYHTD